MAKDNSELWENRELGASEEFVRVAVAESEKLDERLGLQLISIRLPKTLIADLKVIAGYHEMGYQPMIRELLKRFADAEKKRLLIEDLNKIDRREKERAGQMTVVDEFIAELKIKG
jgi:predicted DNA binding CopG/RHH family protein